MHRNKLLCYPADSNRPMIGSYRPAGQPIAQSRAAAARGPLPPPPDPAAPRAGNQGSTKRDRKSSVPLCPHSGRMD